MGRLLEAEEAVIGYNGGMKHLRAVAITLYVMVNLLYAVPFPKKVVVKDGHWRKTEVDQWHHYLTAAGVEVDRGWLEEKGKLIWGAGHAVGDTLKTPFKPARRLFSVNQQWGLFASVAKRPERLVVEIRVDGEWRPVFRKLDPNFSWRDAQIKYRRVRGVWDNVPDKAGLNYKQFSMWLADYAFDDFPEAEALKVYREEFQPRLPWEEPFTDLKILHDQVIEREVLR